MAEHQQQDVGTRCAVEGPARREHALAVCGHRGGIELGDGVALQRRDGDTPEPLRGNLEPQRIARGEGGAAVPKRDDVAALDVHRNRGGAFCARVAIGSAPRRRDHQDQANGGKSADASRPPCPPRALCRPEIAHPSGYGRRLLDARELSPARLATPDVRRDLRIR